MAVTFERRDTGFIIMKFDTLQGRVLGEFITTDVAHMPQIISDIISAGQDDQVIMDSCHVDIKDNIVTLKHLYLEDLPTFQASKDVIQEYITQWKSFLQSPAKELVLSID